MKNIKDKEKENEKLSESIANKDPTKTIELEDESKDKDENESKNKQSFSKWIKTHKIAFAGIIIGSLILLLILFNILFGGNKKQTSNNITINDAKIKSHTKFLDEIETSKDSMIDTLNTKIAGLDNKNDINLNYLEVSAKDKDTTVNKNDLEAINKYIKVKESFQAKQAEVMKAIITDLTSISSEDNDTNMEIVRKRIARYFKDDLSKATYKIVEGSSPTKKLKVNTKLVGLPLTVELSRDGDKAMTLSYACIAAENEKQYTAIYKTNWDKDKIVEIEFIGLMEGFNL